MDGILVVVKPPGMTSHDVVDFARHLTGQRRIGHTGALDPGAAGVLVLCLGKATRLAEYLTTTEKHYRAEAVLGLVTDTLDAQGHIVQRGETGGVTVGTVEESLSSLEGEWDMEPPMVSAARHQGKRLYQLARQGKVVERKTRRIRIRYCRLIEFDEGPPPKVLFDVACSKGTYVRTLCARLGERLGCGAYMSFLVRIQNGPWSIQDAVTLEQMDQAARDGELDRYVLPMDAGLANWPRIELTAEAAKALSHGTQVAAPPEARRLKTGQLTRVYDNLGRFLAIGRYEHTDDGRIAPVKVLKPGDMKR